MKSAVIHQRLTFVAKINTIIMRKMMAKRTAVIIQVIVVGLMLQTSRAGNSLCPAYMQLHFNQTELIDEEHWCPKHYGLDICYSCCKSHNSVCCDDGSCMDYDPFCRYPKSCCRAPYCGRECCSETHGVPCGPVCAPKLGYECCNATSGELCVKPHFCCNGAACCASGQHCCESNICCDHGEECCKDKCCPVGTKCCGNGNCCPISSDCFPDGSCCPHGQSCNHVNNSCCALGSHCSNGGTICCLDGQFGCGSTCCDLSYTCCNGTCCQLSKCPETNVEKSGNDLCCPLERVCGEDNCCANGTTCCPNSPTHHCCPNGQVCCHDHCFAAETGYCGANGECCPPGNKECGSVCCTASETCIKADAYHSRDFCCLGQYCYQTGQCCRPDQFCNEYGYGCHNTMHVERGSNHHMMVELPPPPTHKVNPWSYPCFNNSEGMNSTCDAFTCLEEIASCGINGLFIKQRQLYCVGFNSLANLFTRAGQQFLNCTANCVTNVHVQMFHSGFKPCCGIVELWAQDEGLSERNQCLVSCNFCVVFLTNGVGFNALLRLLQPNILPSQFYYNLCL